MHGFGADGLWTWHPQVKALAENHTLIIPDLIWFGGSRAHTQTFSLEFQATSFLTLLEREGIRKADIIGISYGGLVAFQMTVEAPSVVDRLVLVDSPGPVFTPEDHHEMLARLNADQASDILIPRSADDVTKLFDLAYHNPPRLPQFLLHDTYTQLFNSFVDEKRELLKYVEANRDLLREVDWQLTEPVLLVWGRHDPLFPVSIGERLQAAIGPNARLHVIDNASHAPNIEQPETFNQAVTAFLERKTP